MTLFGVGQVKEAEDKADQWKQWYQGLCDEKEETLQAKMTLQTQLDEALAKQRCISCHEHCDISRSIGGVFWGDFLLRIQFLNTTRNSPFDCPLCSRHRYTTLP